MQHSTVRAIIRKLLFPACASHEPSFPIHAILSHAFALNHVHLKLAAMRPSKLIFFRSCPLSPPRPLQSFSAFGHRVEHNLDKELANSRGHGNSGVEDRSAAWARQRLILKC